MFGGVEGFTPTQQFVGEDGLSGIAVDEQGRQVCLVSLISQPPLRTVAYEDIISSEIVEDGTSVTKTSSG